MTDKSDHEFVPAHELLNEKETTAVLEKLRLKKENFPKIHVDDPQAKKIGAKAGQVIKIYRRDNGNEYDYYRFVVEA